MPYIVAALGRYTVDEVLEVRLLAPKNELAVVPARATDAAVLDTARIGRTRPVQVSRSRDMVSGKSPIMAQDNADRAPITANLQERPAQHKEALLLKQGKSRAQKTRLLLIVFAITMLVYVFHSVCKVIH